MKTIAAVLCFHKRYEIHKELVALSYIISSSFHNESPYTVKALKPCGVHITSKFLGHVLA